MNFRYALRFTLLALAVSFQSCKGTLSPGDNGDVPDISKVILNEINGDKDYIELFNTGSEAVSLEGAKVRRMRLLDGQDDEQTMWEGDKAAVIPAGGYLCLKYEDGKEGGLYLRKKVSSKKNVCIWLQDAAKNKVSEFIRGTRGTGWNQIHMQMCMNEQEEAFSYSYVHGSWVYALPTPGEANAVKAGDIDQKMLYVVINEIDMTTGRIELYNNSDSEIDLLGFQLRWSRIKDSVADNKTVWECGRSLKIAPKGFYVMDPIAFSSLVLDLHISDFSRTNFHLRLRDAVNCDFTDEPYIYDDLKRGKKGTGWTLETLSTNLTGSMVRIPDGTGDWYITDTPSIGAANGTSPTAIEVPELDAM